MPDIQVFGIWVIMVVQVLGKYMTIVYLEPQGYRTVVELSGALGQGRELM